MLGPHDAEMTIEDTRMLARAYRSRYTLVRCPTVKQVLRERASELEEQVHEREVEAGIICEECELWPTIDGESICDECNRDRQDMQKALDFTDPF